MVTLLAAVRGNRLDITTDADGSLRTIGSVVVTGPLSITVPVTDYGRPGRVSWLERPAPALWDAVIAELGYDVTGEWHDYNSTVGHIIWQASIEPLQPGVTYTVAGDPPVLTITGATTIDRVLELVYGSRVRVDTINPHVAVVHADGEPAAYL